MVMSDRRLLLKWISNSKISWPLYAFEKVRFYRFSFLIIAKIIFFTKIR